MRRIFSLVCGASLFIPCLSCSAENAEKPTAVLSDENRGQSGSSHAASSVDDMLRLHASRVAAAMSVRQKACQVLMTGVDGNAAFAPYLYTHFAGTVPGAVLLFGYNIGGTAGQVRSFLADCARAFQTLGTPAPVLFAIDHEGGEVFRTKDVTGFLPSARDVASSMDAAAAEALYASAGKELAALGITLNLAPVVESSAASAFMGSRVFSRDPGVAAAYAAAAVRGFQSAGVLCVAKHFPGNAGDDPHSGLPVVASSMEECEAEYFAPFKTVLREKPAAVLVSHVVFSAVDDAPFCLSKKGVSGILRASCGFDGLVLTDDISMRALSDAGWKEDAAAVAALAAGCDMVMTSSTGIKRIVSAIVREAETDPGFSSRLEEAAARVVFLKMRAGVMAAPVAYE